MSGYRDGRSRPHAWWRRVHLIDVHDCNSDLNLSIIEMNINLVIS